ncbi:uncharacterized protein LAESUDRAFT_694205 [Laetiporus sulphureus 93-53]|uniref:MYND-type domain-containing protein n=1 Tax=Laetiporus sulphureus 93-53 TaxID=1314785 RepID=A0A165GMI0_9APHY|nr:uncharacterized protein LAESUDRAFT_694205 [Laetiporus sulphureus 93-53]KZT10555.1 hypothetical protein LAESUDRAFT_694205 [Laetiporus sulphureus 93-53]
MAARVPSSSSEMTSRPSVNLRDSLVFPSFANCPNEYYLDEQYLRIDGDIARNKLHWCYLGEIVDFTVFLRVYLDVRDTSGELIFAAFHDDEDRGMRFVQQERLKKGHTLVVLYPFQHEFVDGRYGFRMENPQHVTIIPCSLNDLMSANDRLQGGLPTAVCWASGCGKTENLKTCSKCHKAKYCGQEHQVEAWKTGHRQDCKAFRELEWFLNRDWMTFRGDAAWSFPR